MADGVFPPPFKLDFEEPKPSAPPTNAPAFKLEGTDEGVSLPADIGRGVVSGAERGVIKTPSIVSEVLSLPDTLSGYAMLGGMYAGEKLGLLPEGTYQKGKESVSAVRELAPTEGERKGYVEKFAGVPLPTGEGMIELAKRQGVPMAPRPESVPGKIIETGVEAIPSAIVSPGTATERVATQFAAGAGSEALGQLTEGTPYEPFARIIGAIGGGLPVATGAALLRGRGAVQSAERAGQIAGQVQREAFVNPAEAQKELTALPPQYAKDVVPTTAQELQVKGATQAAGQQQSLARELLKPDEFKDTPQAQALRSQVETSEQALEAETGKAATEAGKLVGPPQDVTTSFGITGTNPQGEASSQVRNMITALEKSLDKTSKDAWAAPELASAGIYKTKAVDQIRSFLDGLTEAKRASFPSSLEKILDRIEGLPGSQVSFSELQDLRSAALRAARKAYLSPEPVDAPSLYGFANRVGEVMSNKANVVFGDVRDAIPAWEKAREATRNYYSVFGDNFLGSMVDNPSVSPELTLDRMFSGSAGPNNVRELRGVFGPMADQEVSDWMVGKMTNNGSKIDLKPEDVQRFISNPKNAAIISEVPGLDARLGNIAQRAGETAEQATQRQFTDNFERIAAKNNPRALADFLDQHDAMLDQVFTNPNQRDYIRAIRDSARALQKIPANPLASDKTLNDLMNNNMFTILYGRATGAIADSVAGGLAGKALEMATGFTAAGPAGALLAASGAAKKFVGVPFQMLNNLVFGGTRKEAVKLLQEAARDPVLAEALMNKPSPDGWAELYRALGNISSRTAIPALEAGRERRASGGRVSDVSAAADRLIRLASKTKNLISNETERLLTLPDDSVVHALNIAKQMN